MNLDRALQYNTAALAVLGALFLGLGHESVVLPVVLTLAAIVSVGLSERFRWMRINRILANVFALAAVCWSMRNFLRGVGTEGQLLAIADMLVYLQLVLIFQEKTGRVYWQLIVLSLLQVVVAAALNLGPHFGLLLAAYMVTAVAGLVLLCSHREWRKFRAPQSADHGRPQPSHPNAALGLLDWPRTSSPPATSPVSEPARWGVIARHAALLSAAVFAFAAVFFFATPRRDGAWDELRGNSRATTGVANQVVLQEFGRVHLSSQLVMRVRLTSMSTGMPFVFANEPYFHGLALTDYVHDGTRGRWVSGKVTRVAKALPESRPDRVMPSSMLVQQDYRLEGGALQIYAILPVLSLGRSGELSIAPVSNRILRSGPAHHDQPLARTFQFTALTSGLRGGRQLRGVPHQNRNLQAGDQVRLFDERALLLQFDARRFAGLAATADRVLRDAGMDQASPLDQAMALERHFTESGLYRYSLNLDFQRDAQLDPIEDFVVNHRRGHCEYFASALVMMLRSRGIPARMVLGFRGGDFNTIGDYYQVRQKHAHAWVEALLPADVTPEWEMAGPPSGGGTWYRLDPTPGAGRGQAGPAEEDFVGRVVQTFDYVELLWRDYVLSLNAMRQRDAIYDPMTHRTVASLPPWVEGRGLRGWMGRAARWIGVDPRSAALTRAREDRIFDWWSGLVLTGVLVAAALVGNALVWLIRRLRGGERRDAGPRQPRRPAIPAFYRRLESLLAKLPLRRAAGETARELAAAAARRLSENARHGPHADLPREIVEAYYRVRFGGAALDSHEQAAIEHALSALTPAVHQAHR